MTQTTGSIRAFLMLMMAMLLAGAVMLGLSMLGQVQAVQIARPVQFSTPHWLDGHQVKLREGLTINGHAAKHQAQQLHAWKLRDLLLQGQCVASRRWCGGSKELYICQDPVSGLIGGLLIIGDEIITGYAGADGYWYDKVNSAEWGDACDSTKYLAH